MFIHRAYPEIDLDRGRFLILSLSIHSRPSNIECASNRFEQSLEFHQVFVAIHFPIFLMEISGALNVGSIMLAAAAAGVMYLVLSDSFISTHSLC